MARPRRMGRGCSLDIGYPETKYNIVRDCIYDTWSRCIITWTDLNGGEVTISMAS